MCKALSTKLLIYKISVKDLLLITVSMHIVDF